MALRDALLPEYDHEMASTRRLLERVPAAHVSELPMWVPMITGTDEFDFDDRVRTARKAIAATDDAALMRPWTFLNDGHVVFTMPKAAVLRSFFMNHLIHHRGQLSVCLRLRDVPLPGLYGPTADEG